jgi:hypothetical protein
MTNAASTGLTALPENLRVVSMQSGIVQAQDDAEAFAIRGSGVSIIENFRSGEDRIVLPQGTDLSAVTVTPGWQDDAWGLRISYGDEGDSVFLRWGWKFDIADDLTVAGATDTDTGTDGGGDDGSSEEPPAGHGGDAEAGEGPDTLVLKVSSESYQGHAEFTVTVNGEQVGGVFTASAAHGAASDTITLRGTFGAGAEIAVAFVNDLWEGTAETDRNLHIDGASFNGEAIAGAAQTVWGNYAVSFAAGGVTPPTDGEEPPPVDGGEEEPPVEEPPVEEPPADGGGDTEAGEGDDTLVLQVSGESYKGHAQFTVQVNGEQVGGTFTASAAHGAASDTVTLRGDWGAEAEVTVTFINDLWEGAAETDRNLHIDGASYNGEAIAGAAQTVWGDYGVSFSTDGAGTPEEPPVEPPVDNGGGADGGTPPKGGSTPDGYTLVLEDDFSNGYLYENWGNPFNGGTYWNGGFSWNAGDVNVRDGEMQVTMTDHGGWWTAGGFNSFKAGNTITYGKIEFDAKVPNHQGTMTAILTWPETDVWPRDGEIDILETPHNENMFSTHYEGPNGEHWYDSIRSSTFDASKWNHYEMTWLPDRLTIEVNGELVAEWTDPAQIPDGAHGFGAMGFVGTGVDQWMGGAPDGSTPDVVTVSLDNVKMYQADGIF